MYAIDYDFEKSLSKNCDLATYNEFYDKVKDVLNDYGFIHHNGSFYIGRDNIDAISAFRCVMALNELTKDCICLQKTLKNVRIIEIDKDSLPDMHERNDFVF